MMIKLILKRNQKKILLMAIFIISLSLITFLTEKEKKVFFRQSKYKANPKVYLKHFNYEYLIQPKKVCSTLSQDLLVAMIITRVNDFNVRNSIRNSWASKKISNTKRFFIVGVSQKEEINNLVQDENKRYDDILQANFLDTYRNLTDKTVMGIKWIANNCDTKFVMKIDDDVIVNVPNLINYLKNTKFVESSFHCKTEFEVALIRDPNNKYHVTKNEWNEDFFPMYCDGPAYIFTGDLAIKLHKTTRYLPKISLEDAYVGTLASFLNVTFVDKREFYNSYVIKDLFFIYQNKYPKFSKFFNDYQNKKYNLAIYMPKLK